MAKTTNTGQQQAGQNDQATAERQEAEAKAAEEKLVPMARNEPMHPGGPVKADVHPDEVGNMLAHGWRTAK